MPMIDDELVLLAICLPLPGKRIPGCDRRKAHVVSPQLLCCLRRAG